jgi:hypothetical protein
MTAKRKGKGGCHGKTKRKTICDANALRKGSIVEGVKVSGKYCRRHDPELDAADASRARDERWSRDAFLAAFEETGMVSRACEAIGISRQTAYMERQRNEGFAIDWADVEERTTETMEREAYRRAVEGITEPVVSAGKHVTDVTSYSDRLLEFMLKARRPEKYRDRVDVKHSGGIEQRVKVDLTKLDDTELEALERMAAKLDV